jgi:hypothetical protein
MESDRSTRGRACRRQTSGRGNPPRAAGDGRRRSGGRGDRQQPAHAYGWPDDSLWELDEPDDDVEPQPEPGDFWLEPQWDDD